MTGAGLASLVSATLTAFLALLFARAAWHKLSDFSAFTGFVADYQLVPEKFVQPLSAAIVGTELLIVLAQLVPGGQIGGLLLAVLMLAVYGAAMGINIRRGRDRIECGCGGAVQPLAWSLVGRNAILAGLGIVAVLTGPYALGLDEAVAALGSGFALWVGFVLVEQIMANVSHARLRR
jgi:hypothetical protein